MEKNKSILEHFLFPQKKYNVLKLKQCLENKTIVVVGASFGIGESLTLQLAKTKAKIIVVARTEEKLISLAARVREMGGVINWFTADLRNELERNAFIQFLKQQENGIDYYINNAGLSIRRPILESLQRAHDFKRTMDINYFAPVTILLEIIPILIANRGQIINVSAANVLMANAAKWSAYQASKSAFDHWFRCALPELISNNVTCTSLYFPLVRTRMIAPTKAYDKAPAMQVDQAATIICKYIITRKRTFQPWWLKISSVGSIVFRASIEKFMIDKISKNIPKK